MHVQRIGRRGFLQRKLGLLAALGLAPALLPKRVLAGPDMAMVERRAQLIVRESGYNITVSITDLNTGVTAAVGGDAIRYPGCTLNMLVLASVVRDVQQGAYPLEQVDDAILYTIRNSSAERARDLLMLTGGGTVAGGVAKMNAFAKELGMVNILFDHAPQFEDDYSAFGRANVTTANEMNHFLGLLWGAKFLSPEWSQYLLEKMTHVKPGLNYLIQAGVPANAAAVVGHKNGYFQTYAGDWVDNDVGVVWSTDPANPYAYAISLYMHDLPEQFGPEIFTGQRLSSLAWNWFDDPS